MKTICSSLCTLAWLLSINLKVGNISMWNRNFLCLRSDYLSNYFTLLVLFQFFCVSEISVVGLICVLEGRVNVQLFNGYSLTETGEVVGGERGVTLHFLQGPFRRICQRCKAVCLTTHQINLKKLSNESNGNEHEHTAFTCSLWGILGLPVIFFFPFLGIQYLGWALPPQLNICKNYLIYSWTQTQYRMPFTLLAACQ